MAQVRFYVSYSVCRSCSQCSNSGIYCGTKRVAPNAFRASTTIPQYMTKFVLDLVCYPIGLNVSITA